MNRDVIRQPGHVAEEGIVTTADGLRDGQEAGGRGDLIVLDKLVPFICRSLALHVEGLEGSGVDRERVQVSAAYNNMDCTRAW